MKPESDWKFDPRPAHMQLTELERLWGGPSYREVLGHVVAPDGLHDADRACFQVVQCERLFEMHKSCWSGEYDVNEANRTTTKHIFAASKQLCPDRFNFSLHGSHQCDVAIRTPCDLTSAATLPVMQCAIGVLPTMCPDDHNFQTQVRNQSNGTVWMMAVHGFDEHGVGRSSPSTTFRLVPLFDPSEDMLTPASAPDVVPLS
mmetsp:Transcript_66358/g.151801  ORF Transcript_66358/g.151801 Transcript_66358/m.151801 type:complete len:202 (-) Transcript_66358:44-649(-)